MDETRDVVVIGGGFAGLSAAVAIAGRGFRVAVLEGKPALGGRAYSFADAETGDFVDNGQHVMMGCYAETLKFLERIGASGQLVFHRDLAIEMLQRDRSAGVLKTARLPGPLHMTAALMRYRLLTMRERLSAMVAGLRMLRMRRYDRARLGQATVGALMDVLEQGERARRCFWYPLAIATLNEDPELASAALLAEVLKRAFFSRRSDSAFVYARVGLSDLYCPGSVRIIEESGGVVETRAVVEALEFGQGRVTGVRLRDGRRLQADNFIAAVAPAQLMRLLPEGAGADPFFAHLGEITSSPIICVHAWFDREITDAPFVGFVGTTTQWLFNKRRTFTGRGERANGYLSFVISGARKLVDSGNEELVDLVTGDLNTMIPDSRDARLLKALVLKEKQATMAPSPECDRLRPGLATPISNFFLAGDWIQTGLPATIESAVASGHAAAAAVAARIGDSAARA
ncbi:MAG TPA: hydroxysqualene dehydroxylase HpnE [Candidatus Binataceae bacterium]|jgi:squalene-associated FAD-dependent desaturase|nr:hydroxysqualene dehydroxylase HpnE [Candidatus Binataceae bacterium]